MTKVKTTLKNLPPNTLKHMYGINETKNSNLALKNKTNSVKIKELKKEKKNNCWSICEFRAKEWLLVLLVSLFLSTKKVKARKSPETISLRGSFRIGFFMKISLKFCSQADTRLFHSDQNWRECKKSIIQMLNNLLFIQKCIRTCLWHNRI